MESFISKPDQRAIKLGTLNVVESARINFRKRTPGHAEESIPGPTPRLWQTPSTRFRSVISRSVWLRLCGDLFIGMSRLVIATS